MDLRDRLGRYRFERELESEDTEMQLLPVLLLVLFVGLKLTGYIGWSWLWVTAPMWVSFIIAFIVLFVVLWKKGTKKTARR